ncbi:MAG: hypothetical protein ACRD26_00300 [Vicinamibacterales bacterium]
MRRHIRPSSLTFALVVFGLAISGADVFASERPDIDAIRASKRVEAVRIDEPIRLDGILDEPAWELATPRPTSTSSSPPSSSWRPGVRRFDSSTTPTPSTSAP